MKNFLIKIWEKIKEYRAVIIMYLMMLAVSIISDIVFGGFNIIKYIAYAVLLAILVIVMVVYKDKIKTLNNFEKCNICHGSGKCVDCTAKSDETLKECIRYKENICCSCYGTGLNKLYYQKEHCKELGINEYYTSLVCI